VLCARDVMGSHFLTVIARSKLITGNLN